MARHPRVVVPGVALHVVQRGNDRMDCFRSDTDRLVYLTMLRELSEIAHCAIHAYCLMTNHLHILLTPDSEEGPSFLMRDLAGCYSRYFNQRYERTGPMWEGRFRSCAVDSAPYVLGCYRYIEMNPVRAGMTQSPTAYPWSSHNGNTGTRIDPLLTKHPEHAALTGAAYLQLFEDGIGDPSFLKTVRQSTASGYPLVGEALKAKLKLLGWRTEPGKRGPRPNNDVREPCETITCLSPN